MRNITIRTLFLLGPTLALFVAGCGSSASTSTGPTPVKCQVAVTPPTGAIDAAGGAGSVAVSTQAECSWTASADVGWITSLSPASGQGGGQVQFQVAPNPNPSARQGRISLNGTTAPVNQAGAACAIQLSPTSVTIAAGGGTGSVSVTTLSGCAWTATSGAPWVTITSGSSGNGSGTVDFSVAPNTGLARIAPLTIGGQTFVVTQPAPGATQCNFAIQPTSQSMTPAGGTTTVAVQVADAACSWTAASNVAWLAVVGVGTGSGNGSVTISASANTGPSRTGTATIAGGTFTITQAGSCASSINPTSTSMASAGGNGSTNVTIANGCPWTATTTDTWITITSGASGNGNGIVAFTAAANTGSARTGTLTIANQTFTVSQAGSCLASLNPASQIFGISGGTGSVAVTTASGCPWTATTTDTWITITAGASGDGNGTVDFTIAVNTGVARTGTIAIAGQVFTVNQAAGCASSINPTSQSFGTSGGTGSAAVTTATGCVWTATTTDTWITITAGANGSGNGTVDFTVAANAGVARTGTITMAGQPFTVDQAGACASSINPTSQSIGSGGGAATPVDVTVPAGCAWAATTTDLWITITGGASGNGNGTVDFTVAANTGPARTGTLNIAGQIHTVDQATGCAYSINPTSESFSKNQTTSTVTVTAGAGCTWTAVSNDSWITVDSGGAGTGNGTVTYSITRNNGTSPRTGTLTIAGIVFTVNQSN